MGGASDSNDDDAGIIDNLSMSISPGGHMVDAEDQPDQHRAKSAVARRSQYVRDVYIDWGDNAASIAKTASGDPN